jgi:hypothetical protein
MFNQLIKTPIDLSQFVKGPLSHGDEIHITVQNDNNGRRPRSVVSSPPITVPPSTGTPPPILTLFLHLNILCKARRLQRLR